MVFIIKMVLLRLNVGMIEIKYVQAAIFNKNFTIPDIDKSRYSKIDSDNALIFNNNKTVNFQFVINEFINLLLGDLA